MSEATLSVNQVCVEAFLKKGADSIFVIPEYQRPYAWTEDEIRTLFDDFVEFTKKRKGQMSERYFLGCIVSFKNNETQEIIDGQQRITSLMLLLRSIYCKLEKMEIPTAESQNLMSKIKSTLWKEDEMTGNVDKKQILLISRVINNEGNEILKTILETGKANKENKDNYSKNYILFQKLIDELSQEMPLLFYEFILSILKYSILLPIQAESQDTALTIFSTLNNRGLPLADSDIFKAKIYNELSAEQKQRFIEEWQSLEERALNHGESIQQLFYYYMFYIRALNGDEKTTTPGVRNYFLKSNLKELLNENLLTNLNSILDLMVVVNRGEIDNGEWTQNKVIVLLDILKSYPNEFWKYPVINYYLTNSFKEDFVETFEVFLKKLISNLIIKYIESPTINAVKSDILKLNVNAVLSNKPEFTFKLCDMDGLKEKIKKTNKNIVRMLLKVLAYNEQDVLLPEKWEIEHILPKKYQSTYFSNESDDNIKEVIEHIGNKIPFEKKLNIVASNEYFSKKKDFYKKSNIAIVKQLSTLSCTDWKLEQIYERNVAVGNQLLNIFKQWDRGYAAKNKTGSNEPTAEELKMIEEFKKKGFI